MNKNKSEHTCQAIVVSCMDFRLRKTIIDWSQKNIKDGYDRLAIAGGVKNLSFVLDQIELSVTLHKTKEVYLINHEDCGAYGKKGTFQQHKEDLNKAKKAINDKFPKLQITLFYLKLDGEFVKI